MHIGFFSIESPLDSNGGGGIAAYLRAIVPALLERGHRVTVVAHSREVGEQCTRSEALRVVHIRLPGLHWYLSQMPWPIKIATLPLRQLEWSLKFYSVAKSVFQKDPVDVIEIAEAGALFLATRPIAPLIIRLHGSEYVFRKYSGQPINSGVKCNQLLEKISLRGARGITSPSFFQARETAKIMKWAGERIKIIPNPIAPEILKEAMNVTVKTEEDQSLPIILYAGRLAPVKGILPLLEAANLVGKKFRRARFLLAGSWQMPEPPEYWRLKRNDNLNQRSVTWLGHVPWRGLIEWYQRSTLFVMPSYYETLGISSLEAMAFGLPVVATRTGGVPEVVQDGVTGLLVPPGDPGALSDAIVTLLRDPDLCRRMGQAGRKRVLAEFSIEKVAGQTLNLYRTLAGSS